MVNNRQIKAIIEQILWIFHDKFLEIEKKSSTELALAHIEKEYLENNKEWDSIPITKYYKDFDFLNDLSLLDKNKYIVLYSLLIYLKKVDLFYDLSIENKYSYYIKFHIEWDFLKDESISIMSDLHYHFDTTWKNITKNQLIWNYTTEGDNSYIRFFQDIINELCLKDLTDIYLCENDYWCWNELSIVMDFPLSNKQNLIANLI